MSTGTESRQPSAASRLERGWVVRFVSLNEKQHNLVKNIPVVDIAIVTSVGALMLLSLYTLASTYQLDVEM